MSADPDAGTPVPTGPMLVDQGANASLGGRPTEWVGVDEWADAGDDLGAHAGGANSDDPGEGAPELYFATVRVFVRELLAPTYWRSLDGRHRTWCPQWWRHAEAIVRLDALWRAWEHLRLEPAIGISVWLRDHADPHMATLMDPDGPFKGCSPDKGHGARLDPLPCDEAPAGLF